MQYNLIFKNYALFKKFLLPYVCVLCDNTCHERTIDLCEVCQNQLPYLCWDQICFRCGTLLKLPYLREEISSFASQKSPDTSPKGYCGECLKNPPQYDSVLPLFEYITPIREIIHAIKFQGKLFYTKLLTTLMIEAYQKYYKEMAFPDLIIPIPLFKKRLQARGFNQAQEIAKFLSKNLNIPLQHICYRIKNTLPQSSMKADARSMNVANAFICKTSLKEKHIALIDDVITTGHTVNEVSKILKKSGAKKITVWCVAKTLPKSNLL